MEIVLALAAIVGISLIAVPRLRRRSRGRVRADAGKQWATTAAARRHRRPAAAGARTHGARAAPPRPPPAPARRPRSRPRPTTSGTTTSTGAARPPSRAAPTAPLPESDLDWQMPGERNGGAVAEPAEEPLWDDWADAEEPVNGNGNGVGRPAGQRQRRGAPGG